MPAHEYVLTGDAELIKRMTLDVLERQEFRIRWNDEWSAVVEQGSRLKSVLFGGFAPYMRLGVAIRSLDPDTSTQSETEPEPAEELNVVRVDQLSSGMLGGVMGAKKSRAGYSGLRSQLAEVFAAEGWLVEERNPGPSQLA